MFGATLAGNGTRETDLRDSETTNGIAGEGEEGLLEIGAADGVSVRLEYLGRSRVSGGGSGTDASDSFVCCTGFVSNEGIKPAGGYMPGIDELSGECEFPLYLLACSGELPFPFTSGCRELSTVGNARGFISVREISSSEVVGVVWGLLCFFHRSGVPTPFGLEVMQPIS
jgi:hypothetical protein